MRAILVFALAGTAAVSLQAQSRVEGPLAGFAYDRGAGALRPVLGIPGASLMGAAVDFGYPTKSAAVAPRQDFAIVTAEDGALHLVRLSGGALQERAVDGLPSAPERIVFSPSGSSAALYSSRVLQVLTGLPDSPALSTAFDLSSSDAPGALAISDDGGFLLFAAGGSIRLLSTAADNRAVMDASPDALVAFAPQSHDAAVMDAAGAGLALLRDVANASAPQTLAAVDDSLAAPAGLAFSADGRSLLLASASARSISMFDLASGARSAIACDCAPAGLVRMGSVFRLNEPGSAPMWLLDAGAAEPRIVFVPAARPDAAAQF